MKVADDVGMSEGGKYVELRVQLLPLLRGHFQVADLFSAEHHAIDLSFDFSDNAKGTVT